MVRVPRSLHSPAGAWAPGRLRWGPAAQPISRTPIQGYRQIQGIPLQPSTAQAIIGGGAAPPGGGAGNFALAVQNDTGSGQVSDCEIWADPNCAGGQSSVTITVAPTSGGGFSTNFAVFVMEFSGINTSTPVDKTNTGSSASPTTTFSSGSTGALTQADEVIVGAVYMLGTTTLTLTGPASPWANFAQAAPTNTHVCLVGYQIVSATTAQTYSGTFTGTAAGYNACIASFKATGTPVLVQSPPAVTAAFSGPTTFSATVSLSQPTATGNCLIVAVGVNNVTTSTPVVTGITTSAASSSASGLATCQLGPAGLGNIWYPTQVTLSTTTGIATGLDTSVANLYLGPSGLATTLLGTVFGGNGIVAAALPNIQPGLYLISKWTGGSNGDQATMNIQGVMDALA